VSGVQGNFGGIIVGGSEIWSGAQQIVVSNAVSSRYPGWSFSGSVTYQHIGTFTAPCGGVALKVNYMSCISFNVNASVSQAGLASSLGAQIVDLCIYFYTSNGDYVLLNNGAKLRGYGWCTSTHFTNFPLSVIVTTSYTGAANSSTPQTYDFYVQTGPFVGSPIVTAATSGTWATNTNDLSGSTTAPGGYSLPIASVMHSANRNYITRGGVLL
jgi:hypothetical protein